MRLGGSCAYREEITSPPLCSQETGANDDLSEQEIHVDWS